MSKLYILIPKTKIFGAINDYDLPRDEVTERTKEISRKYIKGREIVTDFEYRTLSLNSQFEELP